MKDEIRDVTEWWRNKQEMKKYTKVYLDFFGYTVADWIMCEIPGCGQQAVDICHIRAKGIYSHLKDDIRNLMAKCRGHHVQYGDKPEYFDWLQEIHDKKIEEQKKKQ